VKFSFYPVLLSFLFLAFPARAEDSYVFLLKARGNPYWMAMSDGIKDTARARGIKAILYMTESDRAAEEDLNTCQTALQTKPKVMVMAAVTPNIAVQCFKQAAAAGIVVADVDANLTVAEADKTGIKLAFSVGSDNFLIGEEAAKYVSTIAGKPNPKIFVLEGAAGSLPGQKRADGFRTKLRELMPAAVVVDSLSAEWDRLKAMNVIADFLQRQPDLDIIYAANDTMALGATEAVRNAGKASRIKVVGVDGTVDARKAILEGRLTASVAQLPYLMGKRAVELALEGQDGKMTGKTEITPTPVLTKDLLNANKDPMLQYVR
jgi:D-allose transport system substrate-binding protein